LHQRPNLRIADRSQLVMTVPFMRSYTELLVKTCHQRGAHAMGGMAPFIPSRKQPEVNAAALARVSADKEREVADGFDGTWVAHPDLVPTAREVFSRALGSAPHQKAQLRQDVRVTASELQDIRVPGGSVSEAGVRNDVSVALQYLAAWFGGNGAVAINNLMEDAATAEISRAQLWFCLHRSCRLLDGRALSAESYRQIVSEEVTQLRATLPRDTLARATALLEQLVLAPELEDFLTVPAYEQL
jgi:malate synthase